jgi:hypothetical protein
MMPAILILVAACLLAGAAVVAQVRRRHMHIWLPAFFGQETRRLLTHRASGPVHVLLCIADHFEPQEGEAGDEAVAAWARDYPRVLGGFRDSDGRPPRHTFFYPIDQYRSHHVDAVGALCAEGFGEIEIHLHHDSDTAECLERTLRRWTRLLADRHGVLGRWPDGELAYGFVHGNWALDNSRPDGRWCGVRNELAVLSRTGCYADFTLPSAPSPTQTRTINSIYYATGHEDRCKSHDRGVLAGAAPPPPGSLLMIQGPLRLWWQRGGPRVENGCIQASQPPSMARLEQWVRAGVRVRGRPDWVFVKLHTHGAPGANRRVLLGDPMSQFHRGLAARAASDPAFAFHYVTAREMYNLAKAAEAGFGGPVSAAIDLIVGRPGPDNRPSRLTETSPVASSSQFLDR